MVRFVLLLAALFFSVDVSAQLLRTNKGNEWIDYTKEYHKLQVAEDGIYMISNDALRNMGINAESDKDNIQIFNLGKEVRLVDVQEGFLFYGRKNRGEVDALGYKNDSDVLNPEYSIITDTASYFLMVDKERKGLRYSSLEQSIENNTVEPTAYYLHEEKMVFSEFANKPAGRPTSVKIFYSKMLPGEGYSKTRNIVFKEDLIIDNHVKNNNPVELNVYWTTNKNPSHKVEVWANNNLVRTESTYAEKMIIDTISIASTEVGTKIPVELKGTHSNSDRFSVSLIKYRYPRAFQYTSDNLWHLDIPKSSSTQYIEIDGYSETLYVLNHDSGTYFETKMAPSGKQAFVLPPSDQNIKLTLYKRIHTSGAKYAGKRKYTDLRGKSNDYIIISHPSLIKSLSSGSPMDQYVRYRASDQGGGFNPIVVDVTELYDQYAYGVQRHFLAIRHFGKELKATWSNPKYIFIVGKGLNYIGSRKETPANLANNLVPTYGFPTSDNLLIADEEERFQKYPIGRLSVTEAETISDYLEKVKSYESYANNAQTLEGKRWLKNVFHLAGSETQFDDYLASLSKTIKENKFGANVYSFGKQGSGNVDNSFFEKSYDIINNGVSIISFMGHADVKLLEANLDEPKNYENFEKYPLFFVMGCLAGDVCTGSFGISEKFVNIKDKGAVAFVATTGLSYPYDQYFFTNFVYKGMGGDRYGDRIGSLLQSSLDSILPTGPNIRRESFIHQLLLNGDPGLKVLSFEGADYTIDNTSVSSKPSLITIANQDVEFCFDVVNIGEFKKGEEVPISIKQLNPKGEIFLDTLHKVKIENSTHKVCINLPIRDEKLIGKNTLLIEVNPNLAIDERPSPEAHSNNKYISVSGSEGYEFTILGSGVIATYPYNYAIVDTNVVDLVATTYNAFDAPANYIYELDTLPDFSSPFRQSTTLESMRSPITWTVNIPDVTEQVYYWRVARDTIINGEKTPALWDQHSFTYVKDGEEGWSQSHWGQYQENTGDKIEFIENGMNYTKWVRAVSFNTRVNGKNGHWIDGSSWNQWRKNIKAGIGVIVYDTIYGRPWVNKKGLQPLYGNVFNGKNNHIVMEYPCSNIEEEEKLLNYLENIVPDDLPVAIIALQSGSNKYALDFWKERRKQGKGILAFMEKEGAKKIEQFVNSDHVPYFFAFKKGRNHILTEDIGMTRDEDLYSTFLFDARNLKGSILTEHIGTAVKYSNFRWIEPSKGVDTSRVNIIGVKNDSSEEVLFENIAPNEELDISTIDVSQYPKLKIEYILKKPAVQVANTYLPKYVSPYFPRMFRVNYVPVPELVIGAVDSIQCEIESGQNLSIPLLVQNISSVDVNTLYDVRAKIQDVNSNHHEKTFSYENLKSKSSKNIEIVLPTSGVRNPAVLEVEINRSRNTQENEYKNNFASKQLKVEFDKIAPNIDVTFDGRKIYDNEIISPKPTINVSLRDKGSSDFVADSTSYTVELQYPHGRTENINGKYGFSISKGKKENEYNLQFSPDLESGEYTLYVSAKDGSGNKSQKYQVTFRVVKEQMISQVYNYPNPFSTQTQFLFTLTGSDVPESMIIRIYTTSGRVVREITKDQLGTLHIGQNKSEYKWDGTDEYGNKLANGVYFYKVITKDNAMEDVKVLEGAKNTNHFKNGFGKLVIMR